jgi:rRNA-processing protein FCF1
VKPLVVGRLLLIGAAAAVGVALAPSQGVHPLVGAAAGVGAAAVAVALEIAAGSAPLRPLLCITAGAGAGLLAGLALGAALAPLTGGAAAVVQSGAGLFGAWVGGGVAARRAAELCGPVASAPERGARVLDTSVLVDGRIADIAEAGFLDGAVIVPQFVVRELQHLADAGDALRRNRGRRGFDVLDRLRRSPAVGLALVDVDFPDLAEVDAKLVALARARGARLLTNDTALARVAATAGVPVGNLNELATALRPVALPGEGMQVRVLREGKEPGQGVAYLDDGTMVVVEGGKRFLGQPLDVVVTSALQTSAGRMIFARPRGEEPVVRNA